MAIAIKHKFNSPKGDGTDATLIRPSNWNDTHNIEMAANKLIGRTTAGPGAAEELPLTTYMASLLNTADYATLALLLGLPTTGDARLTFKAAAPTGWILANDGSIGGQLSGATTRANADTQALFTFFYDGFSDAVCPVQTSAGGATTRVAQGTATVAFNANCRMVVPKQLGRALLIGGAGSGLTNRVLGTQGGAETHTLTAAESVDHVHGFAGSGSGTGTGSGSASVSGSYSGNTGTISADHTHTFSGTTGSMNRSNPHSHGVNQIAYWTTNGGAGVGGGGAFGVAGTTSISIQNQDINHEHAYSGTTSGVSTNHTHSYSGTVNSSGTCSVTSVSVSVNVSGTTNAVAGFANQPHNNMQPWTAWNIMVRL